MDEFTIISKTHGKRGRADLLEYHVTYKNGDKVEDFKGTRPKVIKWIKERMNSG